MRFAGSDSAMQSLFGKMSNITPGKLENLGTEARSSTRNAQTEGDFMVDKADIDAEAMVKAAKYGAEATKAQGQAAGQSSMMGGISSGISGLIGGFGSMGTSGGATPASYGASTFGGTSIGNNYSSGFGMGKVPNTSFAQGINLRSSFQLKY